MAAGPKEWPAWQAAKAKGRLAGSVPMRRLGSSEGPIPCAGPLCQVSGNTYGKPQAQVQEAFLNAGNEFQTEQWEGWKARDKVGTDKWETGCFPAAWHTVAGPPDSCGSHHLPAFGDHLNPGTGEPRRQS